MGDKKKANRKASFIQPKTGKTGTDTGSSYGQVSKNMTRGASHYNKTRPTTTGSTYSSKSPLDVSLGAAISIIKAKGYEALGLLGTGNYAKVYKLKELKSNREVAVKIIDLTKTSENYRIRFLPREMEILQKITHKNIIEIYELIQSQKRVFVFMELAGNGTIGDFIRNHGAIPEWMGKKMFIPIVEALLFMHSNGIAHRDVKVENVLLDKNMVPKLTDFSYSIICVDTSAGEPFLSKTFCGSLPYLPPEILLEQMYNPKCADIWSLGVSLFIMINDGVPFKFTDIAKMKKQQLSKGWKLKPRIASQVSEEFKDIMGRLLEPDPNLRIKTADILNHPWILKKDKLN